MDNQANTKMFIYNILIQTEAENHTTAPETQRLSFFWLNLATEEIDTFGDAFLQLENIQAFARQTALIRKQTEDKPLR